MMDEQQRKEELGRKALPFVVIFFLAILSLAIFVPAFDAPFLFDSRSQIEENERVHQLTPADWFYGRRWLALFSFALNYEISKGQLWSFHLTNVFIHGFSALLLFGIVYRTLGKLDDDSVIKRHSRSIGVFSSLLWFAHPLQTQSVIYTVQRMESMMGMFLLLCLYSFVRSRDSQRKYLWMAVSIISCYLSAFCKEVAVCIPAVVFIYDFAFESVGPSSSEQRFLPPAIRQRWIYYLCLAGVLTLFANPLTSFVDSLGKSKDNIVESVAETVTPEPSMVTTLQESEKFSAAISIKGLSPIEYATNQPSVILYYLQKSFLPVQLCFDRAWPIRTFNEQLLPITLVLTFFVFGLVLLFRRSPLGFCISCFFLVLAPTSSFLPILDLCYEHRMYVPLAAIIVPFVSLIFWLGSLLETRGITITNIILTLLLVVLTITSYSRCQIYRSRLDMWADVIAKAPHNPRGYLNHGEVCYFEENNYEAALEDYYNCLEQMLNPKFKVPPVVEISAVYENLSIVHNNLGLKLLKGKRFSKALTHFQQAIDNDDTNASAYSNLGYYHLIRKNLDEARTWATKALEINPELDSAKEVIRLVDEEKN